MTPRQQSWDAVFAVVVGSIIVGLVFLLFLPLTHGNTLRSAKFTATLSNLRELGKAHLLYSENSDGMPIMLATKSGTAWRSWQTNLLAWVRSPELISIVGQKRPGLPPVALADAGLNHCGTTRTDDGRLVPRGSITRPENLILLSWRPMDHLLHRTKLRHSRSGMPYLGNIEPPVAAADNETCVGAWGTDFWIQRDVARGTEPAASSGLVAMPLPQHVRSRPYQVAFLDGHAAVKTLPELTAGTDCQVRDDWVLAPCRVTDPTKYLWGEPTP